MELQEEGGLRGRVPGEAGRSPRSPGFLDGTVRAISWFGDVTEGEGLALQMGRTEQGARLAAGAVLAADREDSHMRLGLLTPAFRPRPRSSARAVHCEPLVPGGRPRP